ncbi:metallophosphatase domain-containing protein [Elusimicrobiota bacterium]
MRIVCIADTHSRYEGLEIPDGDILIHAGDLTSLGRPAEVVEAADFLQRLPHRHKIVIAGNHDFLFEREPEKAEAVIARSGCTYLLDTEVEVEGLRIYGSPWQPWFGDWAFNLGRGYDIRQKWDLIPKGIDILVTHGPPRGILDEMTSGERVGCEELLEKVRELKPKWHVFGHIHEGYGQVKDGDTEFVNASICDIRYDPINKPRVLKT